MNEPSLYQGKSSNVRSIGCFSPVKSPFSSLIEVVPSRKHRELIFVSTGDRFLYLIGNDRHLNTFAFPSRLVDYKVFDGWLIAATQGGRVWRVPYNKHRIKRTKQILPQDAVPSSQAIFAELLLKENKDVRYESSVHVTELSASQAFVFEPGIQAVFSWQGSFISFGTCSTGCFVSEYSCASRPTCAPENCLCCGVLPDHRCVLTDNDVSHGAWPKPLLCLKENASHSTKHPSVIANSLFGVLSPKSTSTALLLIGMPGGSIWSHAVNPLASGFCSSPTLLCHLEQSVFAIHLALLPASDQVDIDEAGEKNKSTSTAEKQANVETVHNVVIITGKRGKCALVYQENGERSYSEHHLAGPVLCISINTRKHCILYSNGKEICITKLSATKDKDSKKLCLTLLPLYVCLPNVCSIYPSLQDPGGDYMKAVALTLKGKLINITLPVPDATSCIGLFSKHPGNQMKELLVGIEKIAHQTVSLENDLQVIDQVLEQLNHTTIIVSNITGNSPKKVACDNNQSKDCIYWIMSPKRLPVKYACNHEKNETGCFLSFQFHNQSRISFSPYWSVQILVHGLQTQSSRGFISVVSHSIKLKALQHQQTQELDVCLDSTFDLSRGITAEVFLCCDVSLLLSQLPNVTQSCLDVNNKSKLVFFWQNPIDVSLSMYSNFL